MIDQTAELYDAMPKQIPMLQAKHPANSPESNGTYERSGERRQQQVRRLTESGLHYYNNGKLEEAAACYRKALEIRADSTVALYHLGVISGQLKQYEESKDAFKRLVGLLEVFALAQSAGANFPVDRATLARAHQGIGASLMGMWGAIGPQEPPVEVAIEGELEFRRAAELDPNYPGAWVGLGIALHILQRLDEAEAAFRKALDIDPESQVATERLRAVLEDKLERRLFELGYLSKINKTIRDFTPYENRTLIKVEGKPLSETIVEERR